MCSSSLHRVHVHKPEVLLGNPEFPLEQQRCFINNYSMQCYVDIQLFQVKDNVYLKYLVLLTLQLLYFVEVLQ